MIQDIIVLLVLSVHNPSTLPLVGNVMKDSTAQRGPQCHCHVIQDITVEQWHFLMCQDHVSKATIAQVVLLLLLQLMVLQETYAQREIIVQHNHIYRLNALRVLI